MERNTVIAIVLSVLVMGAWMFGMQKFFPSKQSAPASVSTTNPETQSTNAEETDKVVSSIEEDNSKPGASVDAPSVSTSDNQKSQTQEATALPEALSEESFEVTTKHYKVTLSNRGAAIVGMTYSDREIELVVGYKDLSPNFDFSFHYTEGEFLAGPTLNDSLWYVQEKSDKRFVFAKNIKLRGKTLTVYKIYEFNDEDYYFNFSYEFANLSDEKIYFPENKVIFSTGEFLGPRMPKYDGQYNKIESLYYIDKKKKITKGGGGLFGLFGGGGSADKTYKQVDGDIEWAGLNSRYFTMLLYTGGENKAEGVIADTRQERGYRTGLIYNDEGVNPNTRSKYSFKVAVAEKRKDMLKTVDPILEAASDTNKFLDPIRLAVIWSLKQLNKFIPNFGLCLIIFSVFTKLIFLPLTSKSTESMKKMSALQPEIQKLKDKYKDKPDVMQQKTMELYKERGVNPMGGCLPMVVQMPFFIALYSALSNSLDMWNTPFIFWIKDLSRPDTIATISGFDINILPLFMTVTSFFQQKLSSVDTGTGNNQQQMMMKFMPLFLLFIFWNMPSGLILYWTVQNLLQVGHQLLVNRKK